MAKTEPFKNAKYEEIYGDFFLWADRFFIKEDRLNIRLFKEDIREIFWWDHPEHRHQISNIGFHQMLVRFAKHNNFHFNPGCIRMVGGRKYMLPNGDLVLFLDEKLSYNPRDKSIVFLHQEFPYLLKRSIYRHWRR